MNSILALLVLGGVVATATDVISLTDATFAAALAKHESLLVEFYAPWCGHCKSLAPEYAAAAAQLRGHSPAVVLADVDATAHTAVSEKHEIRGFPTIKFFHSGVARPYTGGRTADAIVSWVKKKVGPTVLALADAAAVAAFISDHEVVAVRFGGARAGDAMFAAAANLASDGILFALASAELGAVHGVVDAASSGDGAIVLFKRSDSSSSRFVRAEGIEADEMARVVAAWVAAYALPLVIPFSAETQKQIFAESVEIQLLVFCDSHEAVLPVLAPVASDFRGEVVFVTIAPGEDASRVFSFFEVDEGDVTPPKGRPIAWLWDATNADAEPMKFKFDAPMTAESLRSFLSSHQAGTLARHFKSELAPAAAANDAAAVRTVVGTTFDDEVLAKGRDVLIEFYAPWCGHCKKLSPTWHRLGETFAAVPSVVIAKMDATANGASATVLYFARSHSCAFAPPLLLLLPFVCSIQTEARSLPTLALALLYSRSPSLTPPPPHTHTSLLRAEHVLVEVRGFPTIMFSPADQSESLVEYSGGRSHDDFVAFLRESARGGDFELPGDHDPPAEDDRDEL
jgi:protein disulfide-isomerase A1